MKTSQSNTIEILIILLISIYLVGYYDLYSYSSSLGYVRPSQIIYQKIPIQIGKVVSWAAYISGYGMFIFWAYWLLLFRRLLQRDNTISEGSYFFSLEKITAFYVLIFYLDYFVFDHGAIWHFR